MTKKVGLVSIALGLAGVLLLVTLTWVEAQGGGCCGLVNPGFDSSLTGWTIIGGMVEWSGTEGQPPGSANIYWERIQQDVDTCSTDPISVTVCLDAKKNTANNRWIAVAWSGSGYQQFNLTLSWDTYCTDPFDSISGTHTLDIYADYCPAGPCELYIDNVTISCGGAGPGEGGCLNTDPELTSPADWADIGEPEWISGTGGVLLDNGEGIQQAVTISDTGEYVLQIEVSEVPSTTAILDVCVGTGCAYAAIVTNTIEPAFAVQETGIYDVKVRSLASGAITLTHVCLLYGEESQCVVKDPDLDNIRMQAVGHDGWDTVYDGVNVIPSVATLEDNESISQWAYFQAGVYTLTMEAKGFFDYNYLPGLGQTGGVLTLLLGPEEDPYNDYTKYEIPLEIVPSGSELPTVTVPIDILEAGRYWVSLANWYGGPGILGRSGTIWIDYVCFNRDPVASLPSQIGRCGSLIDAGFAAYNARNWDRSEPVNWNPGQITLGQGGAISQTTMISSTEDAWVVYVVAKSQTTTTLRAALGTAAQDLTIAPPVGFSNDFRIYTSTITSTMPVSVSLLAVAGTIDLDFVCVYDTDDVPVGEWENGIDGDTECIRPQPPPGGLSFSDAIQAWIAWVVEWIEYTICLMVLWLRRIWMAISNQVYSWAVDLGLDMLWGSILAWFRRLWQLPYDVIMAFLYAADKLFFYLGRYFGIVGRAFTAIFALVALIFVALNFLAVMVGAFWAVFNEPCDPLSMSVPIPIVQGFLLAWDVLEDLTIVQVIEWFVIGLMGLSVGVWTINQFKNFGGGGGEE